MGHLFSKKKPRVNAHDKAVLDLKVQRDKLTQYQKRMTAVVEKETNVAKQLLKAGKKKQALTVLKKKKVQERLLAQSEQQMQTVQELIDSVEFAQMQQRVFDGLRAGNEALTALNREMSVEKVDALMEETEDALQTQREIEEALAGHLTAEDTSEIEGELDALEQSMTAEQTAAMPAAPTSEPVAEPSSAAEPAAAAADADADATKGKEPAKAKAKPQRVAVAAM